MSDDPLVGLAKLDGPATAAVSAMDHGDLGELDEILSRHPGLLQQRFDCGSGYFERPYLLWFVAGNPVRIERLPENAAAVARMVMDRARGSGVATVQEQVDYTLSLVCSGRVPRESGVQLELIDVLVEAGADPNGAMGPALAHHEEPAVRHLLERGATFTLPAAAALGRVEELGELAGTAHLEERQAALAVAAVWGQPDAVRKLANHDVDVNAYNPAGLHAHATPLHNAVAARSLETVRALVDAGASAKIRDKIWRGTALEWAEHLGERETVAYLRGRMDRPV